MICLLYGDSHFTCLEFGVFPWEVKIYVRKTRTRGGYSKVYPLTHTRSISLMIWMTFSVFWIIVMIRSTYADKVILHFYLSFHLFSFFLSVRRSCLMNFSLKFCKILRGISPLVLLKWKYVFENLLQYYWTSRWFM